MVESLAGVHSFCVLAQLLHDESGRVDGHAHVAQATGLGLELRRAAVVVNHHRYVTVRSRFGETPDEDGGQAGAALQGDRAPHPGCDVGANVPHLLGVVGLQTWNSAQMVSVTVCPRKMDKKNKVK